MNHSTGTRSEWNVARRDLLERRRSSPAWATPSLNSAWTCRGCASTSSTCSTPSRVRRPWRSCSTAVRS